MKKSIFLLFFFLMLVFQPVFGIVSSSNPPANNLLAVESNAHFGQKNGHFKQKMTKNKVVRFFRRVTAAASDGRMVAILAHITIIGFIIAYLQNQENPTSLGGFHLAQNAGNDVFLLGSLLVVRIIAIFLSAFTLVGLLVLVAALVNWISGIINASNEREKPMPIFGKMFDQMFGKYFKK
jgi:uncharacterized membrane protein